MASPGPATGLDSIRASRSRSRSVGASRPSRPNLGLGPGDGEVGLGPRRVRLVGAGFRLEPSEGRQGGVGEVGQGGEDLADPADPRPVGGLTGQREGGDAGVGVGVVDRLLGEGLEFVAPSRSFIAST